MRKYQRKQVKQLRDLYNSNDPLRWYFMSVKLGIWRAPTAREQKLIARRVMKIGAAAAKAVTEAIHAVGEVARNVGKTINAMVEAVRSIDNAGN